LIRGAPCRIGKSGGVRLESVRKIRTLNFLKQRLPGADLYFIGNSETHKFDDLRANPQVSCHFASQSKPGIKKEETGKLRVLQGQYRRMGLDLWNRHRSLGPGTQEAGLELGHQG
jgi:hypothetical protein